MRNLISLINEAHLFLSNSPKQQLFELTVKEFLPYSRASKLLGCARHDGWRDTRFKVFLEMYEALITFLDAILSPDEYPDMASSDRSWKWDHNTRVKAQELKAALISFQTLAVFLITKNILDEVKTLAAELGNVSFHFLLICGLNRSCLLYTSPSPRDATLSRMPSSA